MVCVPRSPAARNRVGSWVELLWSWVELLWSWVELLWSWVELLWSPAIGFNLVGDLAADLGLADRAVHTWWPDTPGTVSEVRFGHSPGRFDPEYLNSLRAFDTAFVLDLGEGTQGIVGPDTKYHEWMKPETPKPSNLRRYREVAELRGRYRELPVDQSTFSSVTVEELVDAGALPRTTVAAFRDRCIPG